MSRKRRLPVAATILMLFLIAGAQTVLARTEVPPLVSVAWLLANPATTDRVLVDLRDRRSYAASHIPSAVHSDYSMDGWRITVNNIAGLLPTSGAAYDQLVRKIGRLGIGNGTHVVLIAPGWGAADMGMATRLYWSLKAFGHDRVSILDGGMVAWLADKKADRRTPKNPLAQGIEKNSPQLFVPEIRKAMLMDMKAVKAVRARGFRSVDARPTMQYLGLQQSGSVRQPGTLVGAVSLPGQWLTVNGGGHFRKRPALEKLMNAAGLQKDSEMFVFCNTGHWATITWFVASELLGNKQVQMYDGSLADWTARNDEPLERKIRFD